MTTCNADRRDLFDRAAQLAAHRAELAHPVRVADAPPLEIPETAPAAPQPPTRQRKAKLAPEPYSGAPRGRPRLTVGRPNICRRHNAAGETVYAAHVREVGGAVTYIGRYKNKYQALFDCRMYMESGVKPPPKQRGPKIGAAKRRRDTRQTLPELEAEITADLDAIKRVRAMAAELQRSALPVSAPSAGQHSGKATQGAPRANLEPAPMTPEQRAARLDALKAAWRRTA